MRRRTFLTGAAAVAAATPALGQSLMFFGSGAAPGLPTFTFEPETTAVIAAYTAAGTAPSAAHQYMMNRLVKKLKAAGVWASLTWLSEAQYAANEAQWMINWINPAQSMTKTGTPTFSAGNGVSTSANTSYYDTGIALNTIGQNSHHMGVYSKTTSSVAKVDAGAEDGSNNGLEIFSSIVSGAVSGRSMGAVFTGTSTTTFDGSHWTAVNRVASAGVQTSHHGYLNETVTSASTTISSTATIRVLGAAGNSTFSGRVLSFFTLGAGLTATQLQVLGAAVTDWHGPQVLGGEPTVYDAGYAPASVAADLVVYGLTMPAVIAAYAAKRYNSSLNVVIVGDENQSTLWQLGGMLAQGLDYMDVSYSVAAANKYISGVMRDCITYANTLYSRTDSQPVTQTSGSIESRVWNAIARRMLDPTKTTGLLPGLAIPVYFSTGVASIAKTGTRISSLTTNDGRTFSCKFLLGQDYIGTPLVAASIPRITGSQVAGSGVESQNGYQLPSTLPVFTLSSVRVDPYVTPGVPASGLLPDLVANPGLTVGAVDPAVQSMNFRIPLSTSGFRFGGITSTPPNNYSAARYERIGRAYAAATTAGHTPVQLDAAAIRAVYSPPGGTIYDMNNGQDGVSSDLPGSGLAFASANSAAARKAIVSDMRDYTFGFLYWHGFSGDSRIPSALVTAFSATYAFDPVSLTDPEPGGAFWFPDQPYIRAPSYQMQNTGALSSGIALWNGNDVTATDGTTPRSTNIISCCAYALDEHAKRQVAYNDGTSTVIYNQGGGFTGTAGGADGIAPLPMEIFWPDQATCSNFATSTYPSMTTIAFSTYRLEPAMGVNAESIGIAAAISIANNADVQAISYSTLAAAIAAAPDTHPIYIQTTN